MTWKFLVDKNSLMLRLYDGKVPTLKTIQKGVKKSNFRNGKFTKDEPGFLTLNRIIDNADHLLKEYQYECNLRGYKPSNEEIYMRVRNGKQAGLIGYLTRLSQSASVSPSSRKDIETKIGALKAHKLGHLNIPASEDEAARVVAKLTWLKPATIRNYVHYFKRATDLAIKDGVVIKNHFTGITVKLEKKMPKWLSAKELKKLEALNGLSERQSVTRWVILFQYYCLGIRISDALLLRWDQVKAGKARILIEKTKIEKEIPITTKALEIMNRFKGQGEYVFPCMNIAAARYPKKDKKYQLKIAAGMINGSLGALTDKAGFHVTTHMARHSFSLNYLSGSGDLRKLQQILGHEYLSSTIGYAGRFEGIISKEEAESYYK